MTSSQAGAPPSVRLACHESSACPASRRRPAAQLEFRLTAAATARRGIGAVDTRGSVVTGDTDYGRCRPFSSPTTHPASRSWYPALSSAPTRSSTCRRSTPGISTATGQKPATRSSPKAALDTGQETPAAGSAPSRHRADHAPDHQENNPDSRPRPPTCATATSPRSNEVSGYQSTLHSAATPHISG